MNISSRTPEGEPNHCPVCGSEVRTEPSRPLGDAPCPVCGTLLWFKQAAGEFKQAAVETWFYEAAKLGPIFEALRDVLATYLGMPAAEIRLTTPLRRASDPFAAEVGIDSLDLVELTMEIEEDFDISVPGDVANHLETVWDLCVWIFKHRSDTTS